MLGSARRCHVCHPFSVTRIKGREKERRGEEGAGEGEQPCRGSQGCEELELRCPELPRGRAVVGRGALGRGLLAEILCCSGLHC